jgi:hypothetical protein
MTRVLREALACSLRILITPDGRLTIGPEVPAGWGRGDPIRDDEIYHAHRAYFAMARRGEASAYVRRCVSIAGYRTDNGWMVLEARA